MVDIFKYKLLFLMYKNKTFQKKDPTLPWNNAED